jgi:hypothetical protein
VNKTELIDHIADTADISKATASRALEAAITAVQITLKKGGSVSLVALEHLQLASGQHALAAIHVPARPSKSRQPRCQNSVRAKRLKTR